jgi:hypothetical protein
LDRQQAVALLKQMVVSGLVQPPIVSVDKNSDGTFSLVMKVNGNLAEIKAYLTDKNLILFENKDTDTCTICTP